MIKQQVGVIGLAVMGKNLALNIADHGYSVSVYNRSAQKTDELLKEAQGKNLIGTYSLEEFVESLETPRKIIMMVKAGDAVDATIKNLLPLISKGDILMDGGNSYYKDTIRRSRELEEKGYHFLGTGISGGEEGARRGPAIMPGGEEEAYRMLEPVLTDISAKVDNEPCCTYIGKNGAGHFVKMVHNGIEYADMQLICEAYLIMKKVIGLTPPEFHEVFKEWNKGELNSYLIDITADIFTKQDPNTGQYLVDLILDVAGQKGTGKWTGQISLDLGVPTPTITTAVYERYLSSMKEERVNASKVLKGPENLDKKSKDFTEAVRRALYASKICSYAQGFGLMREASEQFGWDLKLGDIAKIFRGGCIIRAQFLNHIMSAYDKNHKLVNLLLEDYFKDIVGQYQMEWREVVKQAISAGIPTPAFSSALAYYDSYRSKELPMNLLQAQRDYFGAHTYQRIDMDGIYHTKW
ncbi:NADP-dependent phosphogluconate dehydrogenase [Mobilitalea sibirica]|uniref:6-phosphogluconate dehydrogenase, decarboxylating n=1 Tax=Mobilitalea sibirica TaxID=1462919 RepID=A0A8J7HEI2_9FIRM|nr:NADP-dependent phosphogluconate dehydrogenase [Mobilitalea sibirica]MBH1942364.1 NADP-dependent phosphogluconate dehydrogenase [Mobilitalea sibirica]